MRQLAAARLAFTDSARLATERGSPATAEAADGPSTETVNCQMPVTFSSSSNSSACCMPVLGAQVAPSYDISASAQAAEQLLQNNSSSQAHISQHSGQGQINYMPANLQPRAALPSSAVQSILASVFDDVDSGRHQQAESESAQPSQSQFSHHRRGVMQQDTGLSFLRRHRLYRLSSSSSSNNCVTTSFRSCCLLNCKIGCISSICISCLVISLNR